MNVIERSTPFLCPIVIDGNAQSLSMSNKVIVKCSQCGHDFITTKKQSGLKGAIAGAIAGSIVTIEVGPLAIGGALAGATIGYWASKKTYCKCPKCGETLLRPEE